MSIELTSKYFLPTDILKNVFRCLDIAELETSRLVDKRWNRLATEWIPKFWKEEIAHTELNDCYEWFIDDLIAQRPRSEKALLARMQKFVDRIGIIRNSCFVCLLGKRGDKDSKKIEFQIIQNQGRRFGTTQYCLYPKAWLKADFSIPSTKAYRKSRWDCGATIYDCKHRYLIANKAAGCLSAELLFPCLGCEVGLEEAVYFKRLSFQGQTQLESKILHDILRPKMEELAYYMPVDYHPFPYTTITISDQGIAEDCDFVVCTFLSLGVIFLTSISAGLEYQRWVFRRD